MMIFNQLGKTDIKLSAIGLGTWALGGPWQFGWGAQDENKALATIEQALACGLNWIDTAPAYGLGKAEDLIGRALKGKRDKFFLATKCGIIWDKTGKVRLNINPGSIQQELEASLRRLKTDYLDLYQIHWPDKKTPVPKAWEKMLSLKQQKKARFIGVSNFSLEELNQCLSLGPVDSCQSVYNLLRRNVEDDLLAFCQQAQIGFLAYSPLMSGLLKGNFNPEVLALDDWRRRSKHFNGFYLKKALELVEALKPLTLNYNCSLSQFCLAWVLQNKSVTSAICGARQPEHIQELVKAQTIKITEYDLKKIDEICLRILGCKDFYTITQA